MFYLMCLSKSTNGIQLTSLRVITNKEEAIKSIINLTTKYMRARSIKKINLKEFVCNEYSDLYLYEKVKGTTRLKKSKDIKLLWDMIKNNHKIKKFETKLLLDQYSNNT